VQRASGRVLLALGFSTVAYTGLSTSLTFLKSQAVSSFTGMGAQAVGLLAYMNVGECISIIFSAILARQLLNGLNGDTIKRLVQK